MDRLSKHYNFQFFSNGYHFIFYPHKYVTINYNIHMDDTTLRKIDTFESVPQELINIILFFIHMLDPRPMQTLNLILEIIGFISSVIPTN
jgi:hypothetical protein